MQKPFCDGCGRELQEGIPLVSLRASVTPFTPGHSAEEAAIITDNYARDYHADCWTAREASFEAVINEPNAYYLAGQSAASETDSAAKVAEPQTEPVISEVPVPEAPSEPPAPVVETEKVTTDDAKEDAAPEEPKTDHELSADSRGIAEPTIPPGVNP